MTPQAAVEGLDRISPADPECAHCTADDILIALVPPQVQDAYVRLVQRCSRWGCGG